MPYSPRNISFRKLERYFPLKWARCGDAFYGSLSGETIAMIHPVEKMRADGAPLWVAFVGQEPIAWFRSPLPELMFEAEKVLAGGVGCTQTHMDGFMSAIKAFISADWCSGPHVKDVGRENPRRITYCLYVYERWELLCNELGDTTLWEDDLLVAVYTSLSPRVIARSILRRVKEKSPDYT